MPYPNEASKPVTMTYVDGQWHLDWNAITNLANRVKAQMYQNLHRPATILCLGRGGMVPARLLASESRVYYAGVESYKGSTRGQIDEYQMGFGTDLNDPSTLVVDEIVDSGATLGWAKALWPQAKFASLVTKRDPEEVGLDFYGIHFCDERWMHFPWEN